MKRQYILIHSITAHINLQSSIKLHDSLKQTPNQIPPLLLASELHLAAAHVVSGAGAAAPNSRSQPKQVLLEVVELVDMEKELELVLEKEELEIELEKIEG
ncbi:uncharacterized protein LOC126720485 [Quercus robur]|uniref:uncharacterized protein LOC126720485 n=1 Tax=Quercus robur TaxID=38942 RepID=UPI0021627612|nr:uncharacterized protein LOC126720485 [Quercus robur]